MKRYKLAILIKHSGKGNTIYLHKAGRVPCTGASVPVELGCVTLLVCTIDVFTSLEGL